MDSSNVNWFLGDVLRFLEPGIMEQIIAGEVEGMQMAHELLLVGAIIMVLPIVMVFLSLTLKYIRESPVKHHVSYIYF